MNDIMIFFAALFLVLQAADVWLTVEILNRGGRELNPFMRRAMSVLGLLPGMALLKSIGAGISIAALMKSSAPS